MAEAPQTHKITEVRGEGKIVVEGFDAELDLLPKGMAVVVGQDIRGWLNREGKWGPYLKVAEDRPQSVSNGAGKDDPGRFDRKSEHPRNEARMVHNAALSSAPALYEQMRTEGVLDKAADKATYLKTLAGIVEWIERSTRDAMEATDPASTPPF